MPSNHSAAQYLTAALVFAHFHAARALREIARVLQANRRLVQFEHTLTNHRVPDALLDLFAPSWKTLLEDVCSIVIRQRS